MLLISLIFACLLTLSTSKSLSLETEWESFKEIHGKSYANPEEELYRKNIFAKNLKLIEQHNEEADRGIHTYRLGITNFMDLNADEMKLPRLNMSIRLPDIKMHEKVHKSKANMDNLPKSVDWRSKGIVTSVKHQHQCGSCWAFAAVAAIESAYAQKTGKLIDLSEQNAVDCSYGNGCLGGHAYSVYNYAKRHGVVSEECYPYIASKMTDSFECSVNETCSRIKIKDYGRSATYDEEAIAAIVAQRVVAATLDAENEKFYLYKGGIIDTENCRKKTVTHSVAIVGYGTENGTDYWIFKNSWGEKWGENGYARIIRGKNACGIATLGVDYPTM